MKQNFYFNEVGSLAIISIIALASFLAFHAVDAAGAIQTINGNNSTNQSITSQAVGNITVTSSSGVTTIGLGWHVLMDNGQNQTLTKGIDVLSNSTVAPLLSC